MNRLKKVYKKIDKKINIEAFSSLWFSYQDQYMLHIFLLVFR